MSNVNSAIASGNPYESKEYKENQNLETSGAMNSENAANQEKLGRTVAQTGTNSAALANTEAEGARQGQRDLTQYNAARDTANEQAWQGEKEGLMRDQLAGANSEAGIYTTGTDARSRDLGSMTQADDAEQEMWGNLADKAIGAGGTVGAAFLG